MSANNMNKNVKQLRKKVQLSSKIGDLPKRSELNDYLKNRDSEVELSSEDQDLILLGLWVKKWLEESV